MSARQGRPLTGYECGRGSAAEKTVDNVLKAIPGPPRTAYERPGCFQPGRTGREWRDSALIIAGRRNVNDNQIGFPREPRRNETTPGRSNSVRGSPYLAGDFGPPDRATEGL